MSPAYLHSEVAICPPHTYVVKTITTLLRRYGGEGNKAHIAILCSARDTMLRALHEIRVFPPHTYVVK